MMMTRWSGAADIPSLELRRSCFRVPASTGRRTIQASARAGGPTSPPAMASALTRRAMADLFGDPFLEAVAENPQDLALRHVYADWLEERGDLRAPFLRVMLTLAELHEEDPGYLGLT